MFGIFEKVVYHNVKLKLTCRSVHIEQHVKAVLARLGRGRWDRSDVTDKDKGGGDERDNGNA